MSLFIVLVLFSSISLGVSSRNFIIKPANWGFSLLSVFQRGFAEVENFLSETVTSISELKKLKSAYEELQLRMNDYENLQSDYKKIQYENERLRAELLLIKGTKYSYIPARVIAKDPVNLFSAIIIDKGTNQGILPNQTVISFNNGFEGLVGRIIEVGPFSSKIMPIFDQDSYIAARLMTSRYEGLVHGSGLTDNILTMDYVKKRARREIQYGDLVVTSGLNSIYPQNIYIGRLISINSIDWETSILLELEPIVDFSRLEYVYILQEENTSE